MQVLQRRGRIDRTARSDPDDDHAPAEVVAFCPVRAAREFRVAATIAETYL